MEEIQMLKIIKEILKREKIEILNLANVKENGCLLSFLYKGNKVFITIEGMIYFDDRMDEKDKAYINKIIVFAQNKVKAHKELPIYNLDTNNLEIRTINNLAYRKIMEINNQCLFYRENGVFGIIYLLCEQKKYGQGYIYKNIAIYQDIKIVQ